MKKEFMKKRTVKTTRGLLVPVWDFFGSEEIHNTYDGVEYTNYIDYPGNSFLTINAADGTLIDHSLGY